MEVGRSAERRPINRFSISSGDRRKGPPFVNDNGIRVVIFDGVFGRDEDRRSDHQQEDRYETFHGGTSGACLSSDYENTEPLATRGRAELSN